MAIVIVVLVVGTYLLGFALCRLAGQESRNYEQEEKALGLYLENHAADS